MGLFIEEQEIKKLWGGLIYAPKQLQGKSLDLTAKQIYSFVDRGALDFGGSEYTESKVTLLKPQIDEGEEWGWWTLDAGIYLLEYNENNENTPINTLTILMPHPRLLLAGCYQPTRIIPASTTVIQNLLVVGTQGTRIKQNARVSQAICLRG